MNDMEVVTRVAEQTGVAADICRKVISAFEEQSEEALTAKFKGVKNNRSTILAGVAKRTGLLLEDCDKIMAAFEEVIAIGLREKLKIFK